MANSTHGNSLWKVLGLYGAGSWVVLQVIDVLVQNSGLPSWVFNLALILLIIGLPVVGATAYLHGLGRQQDTESADGEARGTPTAPRQFFTWKNAIAGGVAAMALWGVLVTGWLFFGPGADTGAEGGDAASAVTDATAATDLRSVAVLPFATRSADEADEYFSEGMHDDVLTQLSKIDSLTVISRTSVMQYAGTTKSIPEIANELGVATILEGGIQRAGDRVRINVQLIEAATDRHLWAETYDEELTAANVFAIQSDLAKKIAGALQTTLSPDVAARIDARPTENTEALELYSRARYLILSGAGGTPQVQQARDLLEQAVELDPGYASAWAELGYVYLDLTRQAGIPVAEGQSLADEAISRALELEPDLAAGHSARSMYLTSLLLYEEAEDEALRALELNPGSAEEHRRYARLLLQLDRHDESVMQARRAVELNPLSIQARASLGDALWWAGDWEGTVTESRKLIEMAPNLAYAYYNLGYGHAMQDQSPEAIDAFRKAIDLDPEDPLNTVGLAWAWARAGQRDSAVAVLEGVPVEGSLIKEIAIVYGELGDLDTAYEYLYKAVEEDPGSIGTLPADHSADPLKADPRYPGLLARVGLE